jgi:hypothetical protein
MGLNIDFIDSSIPGYTRTSQLTQHIKSELGGFVGHRKYLDKIEVVKTLGLMGYDTARASELADYFLKCVESAFERGVFVVSSRVIKLKGITPKTPNELVAMLVEKEPGYFDPLHWYELVDFQRELKSLNYSSQIIAELAPYFLRHVRAAFIRGINGAASKLVTVH